MPLESNVIKTSMAGLGEPDDDWLVMNVVRRRDDISSVSQ